MNTDAPAKIELLIAMALAARSDIRDGADPDAVLGELRQLALWRCFDIPNGSVLAADPLWIQRTFRQ